MAVKIEISGIPELKDYLKGKLKGTENKISQSIKESTIHIHNAVKESIARGTNAPVTVDTGRFLNSVDFELADDDGAIYTELEYAKFLEFGTSKMTARPHFKNTASKEKAKVKDIIESAIKTI